MVVSSKLLGAGASFNAAERNGTHPIGQTQVDSQAPILKILFKVENFHATLSTESLKRHCDQYYVNVCQVEIARAVSSSIHNATDEVEQWYHDTR